VICVPLCLTRGSAPLIAVRSVQHWTAIRPGTPSAFAPGAGTIPSVDTYPAASGFVKRSVYGLPGRRCFAHTRRSGLDEIRKGRI